jgi:hypothetical protein
MLSSLILIKNLHDLLVCIAIQEVTQDYLGVSKDMTCTGSVASVLVVVLSFIVSASPWSGDVYPHPTFALLIT